MSGLGLTFLRRGGQAHPTAGSDYIKFKDEAVFNVLMSKGVSSDGVGISVEDAARVTDLAGWFGNNANIRNFDELRFFTGLTSIGSGYNNYQGFQGCSSLESLTLPQSAREIKGYAFRDTTSLVEVLGTDNVITIANSVFQSSGLRRLVLPNVQSLGDSSFIRCQNLLYLELGEDMATIEKYAFWQMTNNQTTMVCRAATPPTLKNNNNLNFFSALYVPDASVDAYKAATNWSGYASRIKPLSEYQG